MDRGITNMMKALLYIISLIFLWSTGAMAFAPGFLQVAGGGKIAASVTYLVDETFEGTGYSNNTGPAWAGAADPDYTTSPLVDLQSLSASYTTGAYKHQITGASGNVSLDFIIKITSTTQPANVYFAELWNDYTQVAYLFFRASDSYVGVYHGTAFAWTDVTFTAGNTYHVWVDYAAGTGSNGVVRVYITAYTGIETKPGTPNGEVTTGTSTSACDGFAIEQLNANSGGIILFDSVKFRNQ
jgi:hypothetical protein